MTTTNLINQIKMHAEELYQLWLNAKPDSQLDANPEVLKQAYAQLCAVIERIGINTKQLTEGELNEIANHGVNLHQQSIQWVERLNANSIASDVMKSLILFSAWAGRHHCQLQEIEFIVNMLGEYANHQAKEQDLQQLAHLSREIIDAVPQIIKNDSDKTNLGRPWRVLLLNNAIVATRSNQDDLIEQAYQLIGDFLPEDAPDFFTQALSQMDIVGYPDNVRILARRYYDLWNNQTQH